MCFNKWGQFNTQLMKTVKKEGSVAHKLPNVSLQMREIYVFENKISSQVEMYQLVVWVLGLFILCSLIPYQCAKIADPEEERRGVESSGSLHTLKWSIWK